MSEKKPLRLPRQEAIDRRVARTRQALYDALVALILERNYDTIALADILAGANVGKSTFYQHFTSKDDLLARSLERLKASLMEGHGREPAWAFSRAFFHHVAGYGHVRTALRGTRAAPILDAAIQDVLTEVVRQHLPEAAKGAAPPDLAVRFVVSTLLTVMDWWFERAGAVTADEADARFRGLVTGGLAATGR